MLRNWIRSVLIYLTVILCYLIPGLRQSALPPSFIFLVSQPVAIQSWQLTGWWRWQKDCEQSGEIKYVSGGGAAAQAASIHRSNQWQEVHILFVFMLVRRYHNRFCVLGKRLERSWDEVSVREQREHSRLVWLLNYIWFQGLWTNQPLVQFPAVIKSV